MTLDRDAEELQAKFILAEWLESGEHERARSLYDWLASELNSHDEATGNVHYLNAKERIERVKS